jgi:RHS repeat-associated protein
VLEEHTDWTLERSFVIGVDVIGQGVGVSASYFGHDGRGSTRLLTDSAGAVVAGAGGVFDYDAFGNALGFDPDAAATPLLFNGEWWDAASDRYHLRARDYDPGLGRFPSRDMYEAGVGDLSDRNLYNFVDADPVNKWDPTGMFSLTNMLMTAGITGLMNALPSPGDMIRAAVERLVTAYSVNLEWDVTWAANMRLDNDLHSRGSSDRVWEAIATGVYDAFNISVPFTDWEFNPLDGFAGGDAEVANMSSAAQIAGKNRGPGLTGRNRVRAPVFDGVRAVFSDRKEVIDNRGNVRRVDRFVHPLSKLKMVRFSKSTIRDTVTIRPTGDPMQDIAEANRRSGKPADHKWVELGEPHTWHHDIKRGVMQLVPTSIHKQVFPHIGGGNLWYR